MFLAILIFLARSVTGQEAIQDVGTNDWTYYAESHGLIYVVDSSDKDRLEESRLAFDMMLSSEALHGVPLLVLANKQDLSNVLHVSDIKEEFNKSSRNIGRRDCHIQPVSALTGQGVNEGIDWLVECVKRNTYQRPPHTQEIS